MAITAASDIVLDVARAADPERYRVAVERLARLRATPTEAETTSPPAPRESGPAPSALSAAGGAFGTGAPPRQGRRLDAYGQFEALVLQNFVQAMLPRNAANIYGRGIAGDVWRSMLAERIGEELAGSGQVGIARQLAAAAADRPRRPAEGGVSALSAPPPAVAPEAPPAPSVRAPAIEVADAVRPPRNGAE